MCDRCKDKKPCFFDYCKSSKKSNKEKKYICKACGKQYKIEITKKGDKKATWYIRLIYVIFAIIFWSISDKIKTLTDYPNVLFTFTIRFIILLSYWTFVMFIAAFVCMYIEWKDSKAI